MDERPLYISGDLTPQQVRWIKEAKAKLNPPWFTRLERYSQPTDAPLLAFTWPRVVPTGPWAWVATVDSSDRMGLALRALWFGDNEDKLYGQQEWLSKVLGVEVTEVVDE